MTNDDVGGSTRQRAARGLREAAAPRPSARGLREAAAPRPSARRALVALAALVVGWVSLAVGCSGPAPLFPPSGADAADAILETWLAEDKAVLDTCTYLRATAPGSATQLREVARANAAIERVVNAESVRGVETLLQALGVPPAECDPRGLLSAASASSSPPAESPAAKRCEASIERRLEALTKVGAAEDARRIELAKAVRAYGMTASTIVREPLFVAHLIDFSPAAMAALASVSDSLDAGVERAASSVPLAQGLVRTLLEQAAAEIIAYGLDVLVERLERAKYVQSSSLARSACTMTERGGGHGRVTRRMLRRVILRFTARWNADGSPVATARGGGDKAASTYAPARACEELRKPNAASGRDPCREMARALAKPGETGGAAPAEERPVIQAPALTSTANAPPSGRPDGELLLDAAQACRSTKRTCSLERIVHVASVMRLQGELARESIEALDARLDRLAELFDSSSKRLEAIDDNVRDLRGAVQDVQGAIATGATREVETRRQLLDILRATSKRCPDYLRRKREARRATLEKLLRIDAEVIDNKDVGPKQWADVDCDKPSTGRERYRASLRDGDGIVRGSERSLLVSRASICEIGLPLDLSIVKAGAFPPCDHQLDGGAEELVSALGRLLLAAPAIRPRAVTVVGHADERTLGPSCKAYKNNYELSWRRAESVKAALAAAAPEWKDRIVPEGHGPRELLKRGCGDDEECHALNRRMSLELRGGALLDFNPSCQD